MGEPAAASQRVNRTTVRLQL